MTSFAWIELSYKADVSPSLTLKIVHSLKPDRKGNEYTTKKEAMPGIRSTLAYL